MTSDLTFRRSHHHHHPPAASYYHLKFIRQFNFYKHLSSMELKMNWPWCIQSQLKSSTNLCFCQILMKLTFLHFCQRLLLGSLLQMGCCQFSAAWSGKYLLFLSWGISKSIRKLFVNFQQLVLKIICYFSAEIFHHDFKWSAVISDSPCFRCCFGEWISWLWFRVCTIIYWCILFVC